MNDLFLARIQVHLANRVKEFSGVFGLIPPVDPGIKHEIQVLKLIGSDFHDVKDKTLEHLSAGLKNRDGGKMFKAFWEHHQVYLPPAISRLLVNPPDSLRVSGDETTLATFRTQSMLTGNYGTVISELPPPPFELSGFKSTHYGFFDDVAIFWDVGVNTEALANLVLPGSTVTLIRPQVSAHAVWLAWAELDLSFGKALDSLEKKFNVRPISEANPPNVEVRTFGIEAR